MASDNLNQLGKNLGRTRKEVQTVSKDFTKNFPIVEESIDIFGTINPYRFEFKTYTNNPTVELDIAIFQKFRTIAGIKGTNG